MQEPLTKTSSILANLGIVGALLFWMLCALPFCMLITPLCALCPALRPSTVRKLNWRYGRIMLFLVRPWLPVQIGNADLPANNAPSILVCNHQSFLDIYLLAAQNQADICLVPKHWPFRIFPFAPAMRRAGFIDAEGLSIDDFETLCLQRLREGTTLVIFPEGQRTRTGALGRFHSGAFKIALKANVPVLPLVIHNAYRIFPPGGKFFSPMPIRMECLPPVFPEKFVHEMLPHRAMMRQVRHMFQETLDKGEMK